MTRFPLTEFGIITSLKGTEIIKTTKVVRDDFQQSVTTPTGSILQ